MKPQISAKSRSSIPHQATFLARAFIFLMMLAVLLLAGGIARADEEVILTIERADNTVAPVTFTMAQLDAMPQATITTNTPWYDGPRSFTGPRLTDVLAVSKMSGETATATALNDYAVDVPVADADAFGIILATRLDGELMPVRDKGPIFIVYPYDSDQKLQHDIYYTRSVWQLERLILK
jgi:hypothetical protein